MIISFGKTRHLLPEKTVTRRNWTESHFNRVLRIWEAGGTLDSYDKSPRFGGVKIGVIELTQKPRLEILSDMPLEDLVREGGECSTVQEFADRYFDGDLSLELAVINFRFIPEREGDRDENP